MHSDPPDCQTPKKQRLLDQSLPLQSPSHGHIGPNGARSTPAQGNTSVQTKTEFERTNNHIQGSPNSLYTRHKLSSSSSTPKAERTEQAPAAPSPKPSQTPICTDQQLTNSQHKKKKSKKHKDKERERLKADWDESSPDLKHNQENLIGKWLYKVSFLLNYQCNRTLYFVLSDCSSIFVLKVLDSPPSLRGLVCRWLPVKQLGNLRSSKSAGCSASHDGVLSSPPALEHVSYQ